MGAPTGRSFKVAIVMSRLPRLVDPEATWLCGLRACLRRILARQQTLLTTLGTAGADFIQRGAVRLQVKHEAVSHSPSPLDHVSVSAASDSIRFDREIAQQADEILVLGLRSRGNWHKLLHERLSSGRSGVVLVDLKDLQPNSVKNELLNLGAQLWSPELSAQLPLDSEVESSVPARQWPVGACGPSGAGHCTLHPLPSSAEWSFLTHTTRACPGCWPEQSANDFLDSILECRVDGLHSGLRTLMRILQQRRLIASNRTIRGGFPVVSFTSAPLMELPEMRCFRTHRMRWDFEPYGLCVRHAALVRAGARPVIYGTEQVWEQLGDSDAPYFQLNEPSIDLSDSNHPGANSGIDWSREREWRYRGNLDLTAFDPADILVFVPTYDEARQISAATQWPITLWPVEVDRYSVRGDE